MTASAAPRPRNGIREKCEEIALSLVGYAGLNHVVARETYIQHFTAAIHALVLSQRKEVWEKAAEWHEAERDNCRSKISIATGIFVAGETYGAHYHNESASTIRRLAADESQEGEADHG